GQAVQNWIKKLQKWRNEMAGADLLELIKNFGQELFREEGGEALVTSKEILNTILALVTKELEKNPDLTLSNFLSLMDRLESYGEHVPVIVEEREGAKVMTLHSSKGLEFDYVWIAHMDE